MSVQSAPSGSSNYQTAWNKALEHLDHLPPIYQKAFKLLSTNEQAILRSTIDPTEIVRVLEKMRESNRSISRLSRLSAHVVQPIMRFSTTVDTLVQLNPGIGAPIWAPIRIILQVINSAADGFSKIETMLNNTLEKLTRFDEYEKLFRSSKHRSLDLIHDALTKFYVDVIDLALVATKHYRCSMIRFIVRSVRGSFDRDFSDIMSNMQQHVDAIDPTAVLGGLIEAKQHHEAVSTSLDTLNIHTIEERESSVRKWLSRTNVDADQQENQQNYLQGTCDWFFQGSHFRSWRDSNLSSRLWVREIPGSGKSVLSSVLIRQLKSQSELVIHFFCKENDESRNNPLSILRTLLWQFLDHPVHKVAFINIIHPVMLRSGTSCADSILELWDPLEKIIGILPAVYCIIDALDECDNKGGKLIHFLAQLTKLSSNATTFKIFATCRFNEPHIERQLDTTWSSAAIEKANTQGGIDAYLVSRIEHWPTLRHHRDKIYSSVLRGADGMFLWARLMLDDLENRSSWEIEKVLEDMPQGLDAVYNLLLQRVPQSSVDRCQKVIYWSLVARQPLSVGELSLALAVSEGLPSYEEFISGLDWTLEAQRIQKECGSLITILEDKTVQLVHTSLRTYLLESSDPLKSRSGDSTSPISLMSPNQAHMSLATVCLRYNMFTCFQDNITNLALESIKNMYPLLRYSTCNWIYHTVLSGSHYDDLLGIIAKFFDSKQGWRWLQRCHIFDITDGHILVLQGELKSWVAGVRRELQSKESGIGDFVLYLSQQYYKESRHKDGEEDGEENIESLHAAHNMASFYDDHGRYSEALEWYGRALTGREKALGEEHRSTLDTVHNIAVVYYHQGRYSEALEWYGRALAGKEKALGEEHRSTLDTVNNMALVYDNQGRYSEALKWYRRALAGKKALREEHPSTLTTVHNIALVYNNQGRYSEALEWYGQALAGKKKVLGEEHPSTLTTIHNMASVYDSQGQYSKALEWYGWVLAGREKALGEEHPLVLTTVHNMAAVYHNQGQYSKALEWYGRALAGREKALGEEHPSTLTTANNMASVYCSQGQYSKALKWYRRVLAGKEKVLKKEHPSMLTTIHNMASVYDSQGRYSKALEWYGRALAGREKALGEEHPSTLTTVNNMASVYDSQGRYSEALEWYGRSLAGEKKALGEEHPSTLRSSKKLHDLRNRMEISN